MQRRREGFNYTAAWNVPELNKLMGRAMRVFNTL